MDAATNEGFVRVSGSIRGLLYNGLGMNRAVAVLALLPEVAGYGHHRGHESEEEVPDDLVLPQRGLHASPHGGEWMLPRSP